MLEFSLGFMVASTLALMIGGAYCFWRYAKKPFEACAKSIRDLNEVVGEVRHEHLTFAAQIKSELGLRKALVLDDSTVARAEARLHAREAWGQSPTAIVNHESEYLLVGPPKN